LDHPEIIDFTPPLFKSVSFSEMNEPKLFLNERAI